MTKNGSNAAKKTIILYVLNVLKVYSREDAPISQTAISVYLNDIGVACDRKTVGRNIVYLKKFGYPIKFKAGKGYYLDRAAINSTKNKLIV